MNAKQRRMWVLPAPNSSIDKSDRYEIGIFYSFGAVIQVITKPLRFVFSSAAKLPQYFKSIKALGIFISERKTGRDT